jgi:phosphatidylglycerophosphatase A
VLESACVAWNCFDIVKPQPARFFDERVKNGFGVMAEDLVADIYTVLMLTVLQACGSIASEFLRP